MAIPYFVEWQITSKCNRSCDFCYGPTEIHELDTKEAHEIIDILLNLGTEVFGITGGEPLLRNDIIEVLTYIKSKSLKIVLSTNCDKFIMNANELKYLVDGIGVPLDGSVSCIHDKLRGVGSYNNIINSLDYIIDNLNMKLRIGTVVSSINMEDLPSIEKIISKYEHKLVYWKVYELINYNKISRNRNILPVSKIKIGEVINKLGVSLPKTKIIYDSIEERCNSYFLIKPDGTVFTPKIQSASPIEFVFGNLLIKPNETICAWSKHIDYSGYHCNSRCMLL